MSNARGVSFQINLSYMRITTEDENMTTKMPSCGSFCKSHFSRSRLTGGSDHLQIILPLLSVTTRNLQRSHCLSFGQPEHICVQRFCYTKNMQMLCILGRSRFCNIIQLLCLYCFKVLAQLLPPKPKDRFLTME